MRCLLFNHGVQACLPATFHCNSYAAADTADPLSSRQQTPQNSVFFEAFFPEIQFKIKKDEILWQLQPEVDKQPTEM